MNKRTALSVAYDSSQLDVIVHEPEYARGVQPLVIVFVHGSCHTATCWYHFQASFAHAGYRSLAFSLRGHGKSQGHKHVLQNRLADYVADLEHVIRERVHQPFILVGHSFGGYIVQSYMSQPDLPRPAGIMLLACPTPLQARRLSQDARTILRNVNPFLKALLTGNARSLYPTPNETRRWFFTPDTPQEIVDACFRQLQDDSMRASVDILRLPTPDKPPFPALDIPLTLLGAERDAIIPPAAIRASAVAYSTSSTIFPNRGHDLMLDTGWEEVVEQMVQWLLENINDGITNR